MRRAFYSFYFRVLALCLTGCLLSSCGWQLRGYQQFKNLGDERIESVDLISGAGNRLFLASLKRQLKDLSIALSNESDLRLTIGSETMERRPLSYSSTGIPVQYQLIMTVTFSVANKAEQSLPAEQRILARRQYDFDTELVVAKNEEEKQLLDEMRDELASMIIAELHQKN